MRPAADASRMSNAQSEALDAYCAICEEERFCMKLHFEPGDIHFLQNHVVFHSRTEYVDGPGQKRHLMRIWLCCPTAGCCRAPACRPTRSR